ncbi:MAG: hypothetical protein IPJ65_32990 [Archangiaceae bacterium]|nr:hypothetical protein [Archangiaceae bacterium]
MDPFVRRLVQRMSDPARPLSRNKHFHTFESPEGRAALKIFKRLTALKRDMHDCQKFGGSCSVQKHEADGKVRVEITLERIRSRRTVTLEPVELELLEGL